jgi:hypothetical protein
MLSYPRRRSCDGASVGSVSLSVRASATEQYGAAARAGARARANLFVATNKSLPMRLWE